MTVKKRILIGVFLALFIGVGLFVYFGQQKTQKDELYYSGTIECGTKNCLKQRRPTWPFRSPAAS